MSIWQSTVHAQSGNYSVMCQRGLLDRAGAALAGLADASSVFAVSSPRVWKLWGRRLKKSLSRDAHPILFGDAESAKTLKTVERLCRKLAGGGADRHSLLVAVGGGVVGDVAGFVAASYARGIRLVHVPTTLVAQVDSAIGGKTGVNLPEGKNLVGAFYPPRLVLVDPELLHTLPRRQYRSGVYEVVKYGIIGDADLFRFLEQRMEDVLAGKDGALDWLLPRCIEAKARVVSQDEREGGQRAVLNFGHTVGHALEAVTRYRKFLHGEAVGWGMIAAAWLALEMGKLGAADAERIDRVVRQVGKLPPLPRVPKRRMLETMRTDKKARGGKLTMVLPVRIGEVEIVPGIAEGLLAQVLSNLWAGRGGRR